MPLDCREARQADVDRIPRAVSLVRTTHQGPGDVRRDGMPSLVGTIN